MSPSPRSAASAAEMPKLGRTAPATATVAATPVHLRTARRLAGKSVIWGDSISACSHESYERSVQIVLNLGAKTTLQTLLSFRFCREPGTLNEVHADCRDAIKFAEPGKTARRSRPPQRLRHFRRACREPKLCHPRPRNHRYHLSKDRSGGRSLSRLSKCRETAQRMDRPGQPCAWPLHPARSS